MRIGCLAVCICKPVLATMDDRKWHGLYDTGVCHLCRIVVVYFHRYRFCHFRVFFNVIVNAGMTTFYQNHVPVTMMGRVTSMIQLGQSIGQIFLVIVTGITIDILSLRTTIVVLSLSMAFVAIGFAIQVLRKKHQRYFVEQEAE